MNVRGNWKTIVVTAAIVVVVLAALIVLVEPEKVGTALIPSANRIAVGPGLSPSRFEGFVWISYSSNANLLQGIVKSNASDFLVYVMTVGQLVEWANETNGSTSLYGNPILNQNGTVAKGFLSTFQSNLSVVSYLYGGEGSGQINISYRVSPDAQYAIVLLANYGWTQYEPQLNWYHQYIQI